MSAALRTGALADVHAARNATWIERAGMRMPMSFAAEGDPRIAGLVDLSDRSRLGLKGPGAAAWLASRGVVVPDQPNSWRRLDGKGGFPGIVARLATSEFFIEDVGAVATTLERALGDGGDDLTPVLRQDCAIALTGERVNEVMLQTCSVDFAALLERTSPDAGPLALTSIAGVSALVVPGRVAGLACLRIWCDPTFGPYLYRTLLDIVAEEGGGPVGLARLARFQDPISEGP